MQTPDLAPNDHELLDLLRELEVLDARQIAQVLSAREQSWQRLSQRLQGTFCTIVNGQLRLTDYATGVEKAAFSLETGFPAAGEPVLVWVNNEGKEIGRNQSLPAELGLLAGPEGVLVLAADPTGMPWLGRGQGLPVLPGHDLWASPDGALLAVSERQAGRLQIFGLEPAARLASFEIRELGSHQSIHACFSAGRIWISDADSDRLGEIRIPESGGSWDLSWHAPGYGALGAMLPGADGRSLYVLALSPQLRLLCLDLPSLEIRHELALVGSPLSGLGRRTTPTDCLLQASAGPLQVVYLTRHGQEQRLTLQGLSPRLSLSGELTRLAPPEGWPWLLEAEPNPLAKWAVKDLSAWIAELGFVSAEYLAYLRQEARSGTLSEDEAMPYMAPIGNEAPMDLLLRPAPPLEFAAGAEAIVRELLLYGLQQQGHGEPDAGLSARLDQEAAQICELLREHYVALVEIPIDEAQGEFLDLVVERAMLLRLLDASSGGRLLPWRPGHRCPMCHMLLPNPRLCRFCDFALEDADWRERRRRQSAEGCDELIPGQLLLALPQARRVAFLDAWLQLIDEYEAHYPPAKPETGLEESPAERRGPGTPWKEPIHALALPSGHWLVCDKAAGSVTEISPAGELVRLLDHRFEAPVLATFRRSGEALDDILVLDQGKDEGKILSFGDDGRLSKRWGPEQGLRLKGARDLQWTWSESFLLCESGRVLEWSPTEGELRSWAGSDGLQRPVLARRMPDGTTLIADAGLGEVLIFAPAAPEEDNAISRRFAYWPPPDQDPAWIGQGAPERLIPLPSGDLLGLGRRYWMLIQPASGKIRWVQPWTGVRRPPGLKARLLAIANEDESLRPLRAIRLLQNLDSLSLQRLAGLVEPLNVEAGEWLLRPEDGSGTLFFIMAGEVGIQRPDDQAPLATLRAGDSFGEVTLALGETYPAGFVALGSCSLLQLKRSRYKQLAMNTAELAPLLREQAFTRKALLAQYQSGQLQARMDRVKAQLVAKKLLETPLFAGCEPELVEDIATRLRPMAYMPGQQVFGEGESGDTLFLVARGKVGVYIAGRPEPLSQLESGQVFGEMALLDEAPRSASVRSEGYCQLYELERDALETAWALEPRLQERLRALAAERQPILAAAREALDALPEQAAALPKAEVLALARVRPARVFALSRLHEQAFCLDESGELSWISSALARLHRPSRLNVAADALWIADTGNDRVLALSPSEGHPLTPAYQSLALSQPRSAVPSPDGRLLIADTGNARLVLAGPDGQIGWEYAAPHEIMSPWYAEATLKGTVLFCDRELQMVFEIDLLSEAPVWSHGSLLEAGDGPDRLSEPGCVRRLGNGGTLIADTGNDRLLLFSPVGTLMRSFTGSEDIPLIRPAHLELLPNGEILVYPESQDEVIRLGLGGQPIWRARLPR